MKTLGLVVICVPKVRFGDVVQEVKHNIDRNNNPYEFYVAGDHMDTADLTIHRRGCFTTDDVGPAFVREFRKGQVLYGSRRTYLKKVAVADFDGVTANTTFVLETKNPDIFLQTLLPFVMLTDSFTEWSVKRSKGSTNPYVLFSDLADFEFELPDIEEQRQVSDVLWACFRLRERYEGLIQQCDALVQSQFVEMFGGSVTNPMGWPLCRIGEIFEVKSSKRIYAHELTSDGIPFLKVADILERVATGVSHPTVFIPETKYRELSESGLVPRQGDIILTSRGTIGKCYIITEDDNFYFQDGMISWLKAKTDCKVLPEFLVALFSEAEFLDALDEATNKTTVTYISLDKLADLQIITPPKEEQRQYLRLVGQLDKSKLAIRQALESLEKSRSAIMTKVFG